MTSSEFLLETGCGISQSQHLPESVLIELIKTLLCTLLCYRLTGLPVYYASYFASSSEKGYNVAQLRANKAEIHHACLCTSSNKCNGERTGDTHSWGEAGTLTVTAPDGVSPMHALLPV